MTNNQNIMIFTTLNHNKIIKITIIMQKHNSTKKHMRKENNIKIYHSKIPLLNIILKDKMRDLLLKLVFRKELNNL
jgi:hypothetical protein